MANPNRAALLNKTYKILKQQYKPRTVAARPVLEQLLFACCLENATYDAAEKAFVQLNDEFIDWNEVRVSTVTELAEAMRGLPDASAAASNLKRVLQSVFEANYSFELENLKKLRLGAAVDKLAKFDGANPFVVAFAVQNCLAGHAIPLGKGSLHVLRILGLATDNEVKSSNVSGLERTIPKTKGAEFSSLLHQLGADFFANPFSPNVRKLLLSINADAKDRFPKRGAKEEPEPAPVIKGKGKPGKDDKAAGKDGKAAPGKEVAAGKNKAVAHPAPGKEKVVAPVKKKVALPAPLKKKPAARHPAKAKAAPHAGKKKPPHKQLAKRKPR